MIEMNCIIFQGIHLLGRVIKLVRMVMLQSILLIESNGKKVKSSNGKHWMHFHRNISEQKHCGIKLCPLPRVPIFT